MSHYSMHNFAIRDVGAWPCYLAAPAPAAAGRTRRRSLAMDHICSCGRGFFSVFSLLAHRTASLSCQLTAQGGGVSEAAAEEPEQPANEDARDSRARQRRSITLDWLTRARVEKLIPATHVQDMKDGLIGSVLPMMRQHLEKELEPHVNCSDAELRLILDRCLGIFNGIETSGREHTALLNRSGMHLVPPVRRLLGTRAKDTIGVNGEAGPSVTINDYCYDIPAEQTLKRVLQHCPRALREVLAHASRMHERAHAPQHGEVVTMVDLWDGKIYRDHPVLGDEARRRRPTHTPDPANPGSLMLTMLVLSLVIYYDDVEPANSLGHARVVHKMGLFYYALVDLSLGTRSKLHFITPFTLCKAKDVTRYGKKVLAGDPTSQAYSKCTCLAATLKRMSDDAPTPVVWSLPLPDGDRDVRIEVYVLGLAADHPAAASLSYGMRSVSARFPDRRSMLDHTDPDWKKANSFLPKFNGSNSDLTSRWELRTKAELQHQKAQFEAKLKRSSTEALAYLNSIGINEEARFDYAMSYFKYLDETECSPQDTMHIWLVPGGLSSLELAAFLHQSHRLGVFSIERFNAKLAPLRFGGERLPPIYESVKEGQAGGLPSRNAHLHWTAGQMLYFLPSSLLVLQPLVEQGLAAAQQEAERPITTGPAGTRQDKRQKKLDRLDDYRRAWESWQAHHEVTLMVFAHTASPAAAVELDRKIYRHQELFQSVDAYREAELWKPKHNFAQLLPLEMFLFGPLRGMWCMRFEGMNKIMKRFATSGDFSDVCYRAAQMWDLTFAWNLSKGRLGNDETTESIRELPFVCMLASEVDDPMIASLLQKGAPEVNFAEVMEVRYLGQHLILGQWVLSEPWLQFMQDSRPLVGHIGKMVKLDTGEIYVKLHRVPSVSIADCWTTGGQLKVPLAPLHDKNLYSTEYFLLDQMAMTKLRAESDPSDQSNVSFVVERSTLG